MLKLIYLASLMFVSFLLFVFSKENNTPVCTNHASGIIKEVEDSSGIYLAIVTDAGQQLKPVSFTENVILTVGKKVDVSYSIDSSAQAIPQSIPVHIGAVEYLP